MQIGFIGLGKMGGNMTLRLVRATSERAGGHEIVGYAPEPNPELRDVENFTFVTSIEKLVATLQPRRVIWVMVPAGNATESVITELAERLSRDDMIIDGGNSHFKDTMRRAKGLIERGIGFIDCGTSGGVWGREEGYCLMLGGAKEPVQRCAPIFDALAPPDGWAHVGGHGAGHFVKMAHNACEYGLMESYGEAFELLRKSQFQLDLHQIAHVWNRGSVIRSWLLELAERMFARDSSLDTIQPYVEDSGEGRWAVAAAMEESVPVPVIAASLFARFESRDKHNFSARFAAALRKEFGGHDVIRHDVTEKSEHRHLGSRGQDK